MSLRPSCYNCYHPVSAFYPKRPVSSIKFRKRTTFGKLRVVEMVALAEAFQVANVHISSLLGVFLTPELNPVWNDRLIEQRLLYIDGRRHAYQVYQLP